jgi:hypothetical protein
MNLFLKMPLDMSKIAKFFFEMQNNISRDFDELITMSRKKNFSSRSISYFYQQLESFKEKNYISEFNNITDWNIFIDGGLNFRNGIQNFSLCAVHEKNLLIYMPYYGVFYWGKVSEFFVNTIRTKNKFDYEFGRILVEDNIIPVSFKLVWLLTGGVAEFTIKKPEDAINFTEILSDLELNEEIYSLKAI